MAIFVKPADKPTLREAWQKLLKLVGLPNGLDFDIADLPQASTTEDLTFWIDGTSGNDDNTGTEALPLKTITEAVRRLPQVIQHNVTFKINAGTYAETIILSHLIRASKTITFEGQSWTAVTPTTGSSSGTFTSASGTTATMTDAGWTTNDLIGRFAKITSGSLSGRYLPIASNTATVITFAVTATSLNGATFEIVTPGVTVSNASGSTVSARVYNNGLTSSTVNVLFKSLKFTGSTTGVVGSGNLVVKQCLFETSTFGMSATANTPVLIIDECMFNLVSLGITTNSGLLTISNSVFHGSGTKTGGISASRAALDIRDTIIQNYTGSTSYAINLRNQCNLFTSSCQLLTNKYGLYIESNNTITSTTSATTTITGSTGHGIYIPSGSSLYFGHNSIHLGALTITGSTSSGITVDTSHNSIKINSGTIGSNGTWGVNLAGTVNAGFNQLHLGSGVAMSSNTSGDLTLEAVTPVTVADLRAAGQKTMVETTARLNRMLSD